MYEDLVTVKQYARLRGRKYATVKSWVYRGQLPVILIGDRTFVLKGAEPTHGQRR